ncbi:MAG: hypothetical protein KIS78_12380 [Labilithrix sp.]|nr:hypothetical protein [Labilithrix sp.]
MRRAVACPALPAIVLTALLSCAVVACGGSQPPPKTAEKDEGVPANSLSDARLHGEEDPNDTTAPGDGSRADPTEPYTTKVGDAPAPEAGGDGGGGGGGRTGSKPAAGGKEAGGGKGVVSKAECDRVMDKYLELEIEKNPQLKDVPPEIIEQAKQMAREKHGEAPCTATRAQYTCAMSAGSTSAWQRCMK